MRIYIYICTELLGKKSGTVEYNIILERLLTEAGLTVRMKTTTSSRESTKYCVYYLAVKYNPNNARVVFNIVP